MTSQTAQLQRPKPVIFWHKDTSGPGLASSYAKSVHLHVTWQKTFEPAEDAIIYQDNNCLLLN